MMYTQDLFTLICHINNNLIMDIILNIVKMTNIKRLLNQSLPFNHKSLLPWVLKFCLVLMQLNHSLLVLTGKNMTMKMITTMRMISVTTTMMRNQ